MNQHVGVGLGLMLGFDEVLKHANAEPFFGPLLGSALNRFTSKTSFAFVFYSLLISNICFPRFLRLWASGFYSHANKNKNPFALVAAARLQCGCNLAKARVKLKSEVSKWNLEFFLFCFVLFCFFVKKSKIWIGKR